MTAGPPPGERLGARAAVGVRWTLLDQVGQQLVRLLIMVLLARMLSPSEFGVAALAFLVTDVSRVFGDVGLAPALVYAPRVEDRHLRTSFTIGGAVGLLAALLVASSAGLVAGFFHTPAVRPMLVVMSVTFVLKGLVGTLHYLWRREMDFDLFAKTGSAAVVVAGTAGVVAALQGAGAWALVVYALGESALGLVFAVALTVRRGLWRPAWGVDRPALRELSSFGSTVSASRLLLYARQNIDNLMVGRVLGSTALGLYGFAYRVMLYPVQRLSDVLSGVAFPAFCRMRDDQPRLARAFLLSLRSSCAVVLPLSVGCCVTAPVLVPVVFGSHWTPAVVTMQVLSLNGIRASLAGVNSTVMEATGRPRWNLALSAAMVVLLPPALLVGVQHGIAGAAVAYTATGMVLLPVGLELAARCTGLRLRDIALACRWIVVATAAMALAAQLVLELSRPHLPAWLQLAAAMVVGAAAYVGTLAALDRSACTEPLHRLVQGGAQPS